MREARREGAGIPGVLSYLPVGCGVLGAVGTWVVDVAGLEVVGPLLAASVAIGALGAGFFLDLLVPGKTWKKQKRVGWGIPENTSLTLMLGTAMLTEPSFLLRTSIPDRGQPG